MTYRKLIEMYKSGQLEESQKEKVEKDIERHEAISEYLFNEIEIPGLDNLESDHTKLKLSESGVKDSQEDEAYNFIKIVNKTIRKAFIKMGAIVGIAVLAIVMFVIFAMPKLADTLYYNPSETVGNKGNRTTNRISLDMATYSEIFLPGYYRQDVLVDGNGYGDYDINIIQSSSYDGVFTNVAGKIKRDKMTLYDANLLKRPTGNAFRPVTHDNDGMPISLGPVETYQDALDALQNLDEHDYYLSYVTLNEMKKYSEFVDWCKKTDIHPSWCAIKPGETDLGTGTAVGFIYGGSCGEMYYDKETYPYLTTYDVCITTGEDQDWVVSEDIMTTHVISMFQYMAKQTKFNEMVESGVSPDTYLQVANNVKENGLNIYGFVVVATKDTLIEMSKADGVAYIYTQLMK